MAVEDFKERLREQLQAVGARIQETSAYGVVMEKYQDLSPNGQKVAQAVTSLVLVLVLLLIPWMFYSSSQDSIADFETKKGQIRDLYRVSRAVSALPPSSLPLSSSELRSKVQMVLDSEKPGLVAAQRLSTLDFDASKTPDLPKALDKVGLMVSLGKLNLDQIVKISTHLDRIHPSVRMTGMKVTASSPDPHYFDVTYKLVANNVPPIALPKDSKSGKSSTSSTQGKKE